MADDMSSGWGVRTLSEKERAYNPIGYHLATVWPHDIRFLRPGSDAMDGIKRRCGSFRACLMPPFTSMDTNYRKSSAGSVARSMRFR
jgi:glycogen debranching enzyme